MRKLKSVLWTLFVYAAMIVMLYYAFRILVLEVISDNPDIDTFNIVIATLLIIAAITLFQFSSQNVYNSFNDVVKAIFDTNGVTLQEVYDYFKDMETVLGKPWLGKIKTIKGQSIIFGPNEDDEFIYIHGYGNESFFVSFSSSTDFIVAPQKEKWRLKQNNVDIENDIDIIRYKFGSACLLQQLTDRITAFVETKEAETSSLGLGTEEKIYLLYEDFKFTGQNFVLCDVDEKEILGVSSIFPNFTFHIREPEHKEDLFRLKKRFFHIMPHYDFYENGYRTGRIEKKIVFHHTYFAGDTSYGKLELRSMNAMFGANYQVFLNGNQIGTIASNLNINLSNIIFNNFVIAVTDERYRTLMTALTVIAAQQQKSDRENFIEISDGDE